MAGAVKYCCRPAGSWRPVSGPTDVSQVLRGIVVVDRCSKRGAMIMGYRCLEIFLVLEAQIDRALSV